MKIALKYQFLIPILAVKHQFLVPISAIKFNASESFRLLCPLTIKWRLLWLLAKFVKNLFYWLILFSFTNIRYLHLLKCLLRAKDNKAVTNSGSNSMAVLSIFSKILGKICHVQSERDIPCYIFQNISRTKLILIHEKIPNIIRYYLY